MPRRRKVNNLLALAVLSALVTRPMHPYEVASSLRAWGKEQDMNIKWGTLYTVVGNLEKHGFIQAAQTERQGGRPERTVYQITGAGRAELGDWVRELIAVPEPETPRYEAGLSVVGILGPDEVAGLLRQRLEVLDEQIAADGQRLAETAARVPRLFLIEAEYDLALRRAEADWTRDLVRELTEGTFPMIDQWRAWHQTGELPPEVAQLAEGGADPD
jgi:DNA-binding PadR family transcriptional regulator